MTPDYRFAYDPGTIVYGRNCVSRLEHELERIGAERALVVCGSTVGATDAVIDPVVAGAGDRLAGVFDETTPEKRLSTAFDGADRMSEDDIDALVSLGGGSSLDIAKVMSVLAASERPRGEIESTFERERAIAIPDSTLPPIVALPTTLAGSDLSAIAGITVREGGLTRGALVDDRLMPAALCYDPALFETTPHEILCASAMNGFDKAVESLYGSNATPITDGTAVRSLRLLGRGLPRLGAGDRDQDTLHDAIMGTVLAQYGALGGERITASLIHSFGHGIARGYAIQQGGAHGIVAPHVLRYLFDNVDARRDLLAEGVDVDTTGTPEETATAVVDAVTEIRDALGLPSRLRTIDDLSKRDLPAVAADIADDVFIPNVPPGLEPTEAELEGVLRNAW
ncbi:iron-containing alcohol dehydrogenase [Salinadaptatus halalkaliphilus]|uniref:Iron-containing alcohol dehydrogenase n=1 Tax=Salinadaptatus halalkaliphilus TaxID=2419781 RepID=A0A4S3TNY3_9EURY|nr:iron-containing alcohol dehydrogenase family protein [Salinadaptatus halalkaliphilus]THE66012.1 iron-containing alcohol dehydrogenase [Salinadaptatus halalkaliphilus]